MDKKRKFLVKTLGCKANFSDSQALEADLLSRGLLPAESPAEADLVIVNSCTVTDEAEQQSRKAIRDARRKNPSVRVVYTGCGAEVDPTGPLKVEGIGAVLGNQDKPSAGERILEWLERSPGAPEILGSVREYGELLSKHPMDRDWPLVEEGLSAAPVLPEEASSFRTRAFLKIQEGCDSFCTYCIIPYGRGPARSLPAESVLERVHRLVKDGVREVVLTGTNLGDYGLDPAGSSGVEDLVELILTRTGLERLRIGSLDPVEISPRLLQLMQDHPNFCPHLHVSLQHTESSVLRRMKRKYGLAEVESLFERIAKLDRKPFIGMDLITGFPGETEVEFSDEWRRLENWSWNRLHVFPYSERTGTPATRLPGRVPPAVRKERARALQQLSLERMTRNHAASGLRNGILRGVLLEGAVRGPDGSRDWISGYTPDYQRVLLPGGAAGLAYRNSIVDVRVGSWVVDRVSGEVSWMGEHHGA